MSRGRILLYGVFKPQSYERCWLEWLDNQGYEVKTFERDIANRKLSGPVYSLLWRRWPQILAWLERWALNHRVRSVDPDLVLVVSGYLVTGSAIDTIKAQTSATIIHFYNEDYFNPLNTKPFMLAAAGHYDYVFTTKSFNVPELRRRGVANVSYVPHGYRPNCHYPVSVTEQDRKRYGADVAFVGTWEQARASDLESLCDFDLKVWGNDWDKLNPESPLAAAIQHEAVYCEGISKIFNSTRINLAFLRKANRDCHTSRTFEIPACGGFQLSERTSEILEFFKEGAEIECFGDVEEMKDKIRYYLAHESERRRIAAAGFERLQKSKYSFTDRLETVMQQYHRMRSN